MRQQFRGLQQGKQASSGVGEFRTREQYRAPASRAEGGRIRKGGTAGKLVVTMTMLKDCGCRGASVCRAVAIDKIETGNKIYTVWIKLGRAIRVLAVTEASTGLLHCEQFPRLHAKN